MINFILAVCGLTIIVVRSKIFKPVRIFFTLQYEKRKSNRILYFIDSILCCYMCFSVWAGILLSSVKFFFPGAYDVVVMPLGAVSFVVVFFELWDFIKRK